MVRHAESDGAIDPPGLPVLEPTVELWADLDR